MSTDVLKRWRTNKPVSDLSTNGRVSSNRDDWGEGSESWAEYSALKSVDAFDPAAMKHQVPNDGGGIFEVNPNLANMGWQVTFGGVMEKGATGTVTVQWPHIVDSIVDKELKSSISKLSPSQCLPNKVKIISATVGANCGTRNMCHVEVLDHTRKAMNTPHLFKSTTSASKPVGYPLHLLQPEGGYILEEPPQLTDTFRHYWYVSKRMLTSSAFKHDMGSSTFYAMHKNSEAARIMYHVLVTRNGANSGNDITGLDAESFEKAYNFETTQDELPMWRFPEAEYKEVLKLLASKLEDVKSKSFNCESVTVNVAPFDVFKPAITKLDSVPFVITLEIDLYLPMLDAAMAMEPKANTGAPVPGFE